MAALAIDSQYVIFPPGVTTTRPGSVELAEGDTKEPSGWASVLDLFDVGRVNVKVSGDVWLTAYGHTTTCVGVIDRA